MSGFDQQQMTHERLARAQPFEQEPALALTGVCCAAMALGSPKSAKRFNARAAAQGIGGA
ncbi:MAG: hypothetical protein ABL932_16905 [Terricaulis sp.]